ncbi:hypothetical protein SmJEL517_g02807 [Synchytrium microbalum]|uniref:Arrestin-like N-terminal domain-containing protein n=1 Tax=Synchytrium microbalum TaxID=1806994 RepID=A0A507C4A2_9FUNG|nr:uncharacterized protein SmJEL517_g02807 [Synchytrium microbalum]TPX34492.1 hypothetical protein SmJEL517_g02807 [Synchytrium microbalum]
MKVEIVPAEGGYIRGRPGLTKAYIVGSVLLKSEHNGSMKSAITSVKITFSGTVETDINISGSGNNSQSLGLRSHKSQNAIISLSQELPVGFVGHYRNVEIPFEFELPDDPLNDDRWVLPVSCGFGVQGVYRFGVKYTLSAKPNYTTPALARVSSSGSVNSLGSISSSISSLSSSPLNDKLHFGTETVPVELHYYNPAILLKLIQSYDDEVHHHLLGPFRADVSVSSTVLGRTDPIFVKMTLTPIHAVDAAIIHTEVSLKEYHIVNSGKRRYQSTRHLISSTFPDLNKGDTGQQTLRAKLYVPRDACTSEDIPFSPMPSTEASSEASSSVRSSETESIHSNHSHSTVSSTARRPFLSFNSHTDDESHPLTALGFSSNCSFEVSHFLKYTVMAKLDNVIKGFSWEYPVMISSVKQSQVFDLLENDCDLIPPQSYEKASGNLLATTHTPLSSHLIFIAAPAEYRASEHIVDN